MNKLNGQYAAPTSRGLSAHEIAALMLLHHAPVAATIETLDIAALCEAGLAELIELASGVPQFSITRKGKVLLQILDDLIERDDGTRVDRHNA